MDELDSLNNTNSFHSIGPDGVQRHVNLNYIMKRVEDLCDGLDGINAFKIQQLVVPSIRDQLETITDPEVDELIADHAASLTVEHPDYSILAARVAITNLYRSTESTFSHAMTYIYQSNDLELKKPLISDEFYQIVMDNKERLDMVIDESRDNQFTYFGFRTLERGGYLMKVKNKIVERPQFAFMRVAIAIHGNDINAAIETYDLMSKHFFIHSTPIFFNAGRRRYSQLASSYSFSIAEDSIASIYTALPKCASISKVAGGISLSVNCIRATGSVINGTSWESVGLLPMLKNVDGINSHVQQALKRPGIITIYLESWHADVVDVVQMCLKNKTDDKRCDNLLLALWVSDLFMKRVEIDGIWSLMSPDECPGLEDVYGDEFVELYESYERENRYRTQVKARDLWRIIVNNQCESGLPYILFKDTCNFKSNQRNLGTIKCGGVCGETVQYSNSDEFAVSTMASIALNQFVIVNKNQRAVFDFEALRQVSKIVARNLDKIIDINQYPVEEARISNIRHRPIAIGVQGLADAFILMRFSFTSPEARKLNKQIFETIYYGALEASCELAEQLGSYETYEGSPISKGILQYDMWNVTPTDLWDWQALKVKIAKFGVRNSLLTAVMQTSSTSKIFGNNKSVEPYASSLSTYHTFYGNFQVVNQHLIRDLVKENVWSQDLIEKINECDGSIQSLIELPQELRDLYKTIWELKQLDLIEMAADRGAFIDQSQSMNVFIEFPNQAKMNSVLLKAWKDGLKTGMSKLYNKQRFNPMKIVIKKHDPDFMYDFEKSPFGEDPDMLQQHDSAYFSQTSQNRRSRNENQVRYESFDSSQSQNSTM